MTGSRDVTFDADAVGRYVTIRMYERIIMHLGQLDELINLCHCSMLPEYYKC